MKTKEFIAKMKELGYHAEIAGDTIVVKVLSPHFSNPHDVHGWFKIKNITKDAYLVISEGRLIPQSDTNVLLAIAEYLSTPAGEREEEKKYRLFLPDAFSKTIHSCLNLKKEYGAYIFDTITEIDIYQTKFTQKEIDDMPFDTNFFIKEEIND